MSSRTPLITLAAFAASLTTVCSAYGQSSSDAPLLRPTQPSATPTPAPPPATPLRPGPPPPAPPSAQTAPAPASYGQPTYAPWQVPPYSYPAVVYVPMRPDKMPYRGGAVPPGYRLESRTRKGLVIAGGILTGLGGLLIFAGVAEKYDDDEPERYQGEFDDNGDLAIGLGALLAVPGAILLTIGVAAKKKWLIRDNPAVGGKKPRPPVAVSLSPRLSRKGGSLGLHGSF